MTSDGLYSPNQRVLGHLSRHGPRSQNISKWFGLSVRDAALGHPYYAIGERQGSTDSWRVAVCGSASMSSRVDLSPETLPTFKEEEWREFAEAAYRAISEYRVTEAKEPGRLRVSADWSKVAGCLVWGLLVVVDETLPGGSIVPYEFCMRHQWSTPDGFVSKVELDPPNAEGWQAGRLVDTKPGPRCLRCGATEADVV